MRRIDDLIDKINNIADVEQNKIDWKNVEFENLSSIWNSELATNWNFNWLKNEFDTMFNKALKTTKKNLELYDREDSFL